MKILLQRVKSSFVVVGDKTISSIGAGLLVFIGVEKGDSNFQADFLANKVSKLRIFDDKVGKMNLSIKDVEGEVLVVSQFTLAGDVSKGNRPGFDSAEDPIIAKNMYEYFVQELQKKGIIVKTGEFQADMKVHLINDGPVTFILEK